MAASAAGRAGGAGQPRPRFRDSNAAPRLDLSMEPVDAFVSGAKALRPLANAGFVFSHPPLSRPHSVA